MKLLKHLTACRAALLPVAAAGAFIVMTGPVYAGGLSSRLPSAGVSYTLSGGGVTLRDVEEALIQEGKLVVEQAETAAVSEEPLPGEAAPAPLVIEEPIPETADVSEAEAKAIITADGSVSSTDAANPSASAGNAQAGNAQAGGGAAQGSGSSEADSSASSSILTTVLTTTQKESMEKITAAVDAAAKEGTGTNQQAAGDAASAATAEAEASGGQKKDNAVSAGENSGEAASIGGIAQDRLAVSTASDYVNVRKEADTDAEIVGKLYSNGVAEILSETEDGWMEIRSGDVQGFVKKDFVTTGSEAADLAEQSCTKVAKVTTETLRVRAAADIESDVITLLPLGEKLEILEETDGWIKVSTSDGEGYISSDFADVEAEYVEAESREQEEARLKAEKKESGSGGSGSGSSGSLGSKIASYAQQFLGNPYVWGGSSLTNGTDCSGFTMSVYAHFGYSLPHYDASQRAMGTAVSSLSEAQPGDLVFYSGHVGIYIGGGQIVHASNPTYGIRISNATYRSIVAIRRIVQ